MKITAIVILGALFVSNALARIGETSNEATERYGHSNESFAGTYSNTIVRLYNKAGIKVEALFFMDHAGKSVIGQIKYSLPEELSQSNLVAKAVFLQLLEDNAGGQHWEMQNNLPTTQNFQREGAFATMTATLLTVTLGEYGVFLDAEKAHLAGKQSGRIDKQLKDF